MGFRGPARDHAPLPEVRNGGVKIAGQGWIGWAAGWKTKSIGSSMRTRIGANRGRSLRRGKACPGNLFSETMFGRLNRLDVAPWRRSLAGGGLEMLGLAKTGKPLKQVVRKIGPTTPVFQSPGGSASQRRPSLYLLMPQTPSRQAPADPCPVPPDAAGPNQVSSAGEKTSRITVSSLPPRKKR